MNRTTESTVPEIVEPASVRWRTSPIDGRGWLMMLATFAVSTTVLTLVGLAIVEWWEPSAAGTADADLNRWLEERRTGGLTSMAEWVSFASDTPVKVALALVLLPVMLLRFRRWHEWALIVGGLAVEVCAFGLSSTLVGRDRPPVEQLDGAPTDSFPSGHIAAATVFYAGVAIVVWMRTRRRGPRVAAAIVGIGMPLAMVAARLYLGMHYVTDAIAGLVLGGVVLALMYRVVHRTLPPDESPAAHDAARGRTEIDDRSVASLGR